MRQTNYCFQIMLLTRKIRAAFKALNVGSMIQPRAQSPGRAFQQAWRSVDAHYQPEARKFKHPFVESRRYELCAAVESSPANLIVGD